MAIVHTASRIVIAFVAHVAVIALAACPADSLDRVGDEGEGEGEGEGEAVPCGTPDDCAPGLECVALDGALAACVAPGGIDASCDPDASGGDDGCDDALRCQSADPPFCSCDGPEDCAPGDVCFLQTPLLGDGCRNECRPQPALDDVCAFFHEDECIADGASCADGLECIQVGVGGDTSRCNVSCDPVAEPDPCAPAAECMTDGACRSLDVGAFCNIDDPPEHDGCVAPLTCNPNSGCE
jgi:hypothetical protein